MARVRKYGVTLRRDSDDGPTARCSRRFCNLNARQITGAVVGTRRIEAHAIGCGSKLFRNVADLRSKTLPQCRSLVTGAAQASDDKSSPFFKAGFFERHEDRFLQALFHIVLLF